MTIAKCGVLAGDVCPIGVDSNRSPEHLSLSKLSGAFENGVERNSKRDVGMERKFVLRYPYEIARQIPFNYCAASEGTEDHLLSEL